MPDFDRLFRDFDEVHEKPDRDSSRFRNWILILGLAVSATVPVVTFNI
jgi:hypothetical protein